MRTDAKIILSRGRWCVAVETAGGWVDWPIMYDNGRIAYDFPERIPKFIRPKVARLLRECKRRNRKLTA